MLPFVLPDKVLDKFQLVVDGRRVFVNHRYMGLNAKKEKGQRFSSVCLRRHNFRVCPPVLHDCNESSFFVPQGRVEAQGVMHTSCPVLHLSSISFLALQTGGGSICLRL